MSAVCTYLLTPWYYLGKMMPEDTGSRTDSIRKIGRYASGIIGLGAGCTAAAFVTPLVYVSASTADAKTTEATTPDGTPFKDQSVTLGEKVGGGIAAATVAYVLISHITVASVAVGGLLTDCAIECVECCYEATATKCSTAALCLKKAFCCQKKAPSSRDDIPKKSEELVF